MNEPLFFHFDGLTAKSTKSIAPDNRGFRYGDGFFESILLRNADFPFLDFHLQRIFYSLRKLKFEAPEFLFDEKYWKNTLFDLAQNQKNGRFRLSFFRGGRGLYLPEDSHFTEFLAEVRFSEFAEPLCNKTPLKICNVESVRKDFSYFSEIKSLNAQIYVLAALEVRKKNAQEGIIFNSKNEIVECLSANIFLLKNHQIFTPAVSAGCVAGVFRAFFIEKCRSNSIQIIEKKLCLEDFNEADAVLTTNAVAGLRFIRENKKTDLGSAIEDLF